MSTSVFKADLHMHSTCSDGKFSPEELVRRAKDYGIACISLTDHDTMDGVEEALDAGSRLGVEVIPGVEVTANLDGREAHVLCYGGSLSDKNWRKLLSNQQQMRKSRAEGMIEKLSDLNIFLDLDQIQKDTGTDLITRPHLAHALVKAGHAAHTQDAFARFIGNTAPAYVPLNHITVQELVDVAHQAGCAVVLAHPGSLYSADQLQRMIGYGMDGLECVHPSHNYKQQVYYRELATKNGMFCTAGSDFHGFRFQDFSYYGYITADREAVSALKQCYLARKEAFLPIES